MNEKRLFVDERHRFRAVSRFIRCHPVRAGIMVAALGVAFAYTQWLMWFSGAVTGKVWPLLLAPLFLAVARIAVACQIRVSRRLAARRHSEPQPIGPPIEHIAAELRRLLLQHDVLMRTEDGMVAVKHLWALEVAITRRAIQAARALDVPYPNPPEIRGLDRSELRTLLRALAAEGLVLPSTVGLMSPDIPR